jgi:hypothetical protein
MSVSLSGFTTTGAGATGSGRVAEKLVLLSGCGARTAIFSMGGTGISGFTGDGASFFWSGGVGDGFETSEAGAAGECFVA